MKKIFITAVGGDIGYGIIKSLKAYRNDLHIIGCDINKYNVSYDLADEFYISPAYRNEDEWLEFVCGITVSKQVDYFWPVTEPEIKIVSKHMERFAHTEVVMNAPNILQIAMDKGLTAGFLSEGGIRVPKTWDDLETAERKFPLIVKERFGCGSHSVCIADNEHDLRQAYEGMEHPIIQEYVGNDSEEYTLTVFSDGKTVNYIAFKRQLGFGGMSRYVELVNSAPLAELAKKAARLFDLHGSVNVQMRRCGDDYYIFEINPRISSTIGFRSKLGFNDAAWWLDMLEGKNVPPYVYPTERMFGVRSVEEKIFFEQGADVPLC